MNNLEKYLDQVIEQKPVVYEPPGAVTDVPPGPEEPPSVNVLASVRRRWYIVVLVTIVLCALALPALWLVIEPRYVVQGAVRIRPAVPGILTGEPSQTGDLGSYSDFVNTQAVLLLNNNLQRVVDELVGRNLSFLSGTPQNRIEQLLALISPTKRKLNPESILKDAIAGKKITANPIPRTELLAVAMRTTRVEEAKAIVDCFLRNYVAQFGLNAGAQERDNLSFLEKQKEAMEKRIKEERAYIRDLAARYSTITPGPREEMELNVQARLMGELINLESQKIAAEANVSLLEKTNKVEVPPEQMVSLRREYVNSDPMVAEWSKSIVSMERDLIMQQALIRDHPRLAQEQAALESLTAKLDTKRQGLEQEYDRMLEARQKEAAQQRLMAAQMELERISAHYTKITEVVDLQEKKVQKVGQTNMEIQDAQFQLQLDQDQYEQLSRRVKTLQVEQRQTPRIESAYAADVAETDDRRPQLATAAVIGALACGVGLALLRDRMDKTLQTPEDVTRQLDLAVLGTTTSSRAIKPALLAEQIAGDYQTIRTNLGLAYDGGLPRKLVVSSAGTREGKTTFAVNLATSLAKSGKRVLLIDGDLRKPDVGQMLNVPRDAGYLQEVLLGGDGGSAAYVSPSSGLHVLAANPRHMADPYELLTSATAAEQIERLTREYDHVVIDSPPALAFPDALVWARLADAVVLVGFAGQTTAPELKEAKERFARGRARVLGAILSNVPVDQGLYRYAYTYRARGAQPGRKAKKLLLATGVQKPGDNGGAA
jgi:succinoglycan biosynthesis transport protein ExoP